MSKYIKLEDAISKIVNTPTRVITDDLTALADRQHEIIDMLADLPTIEVSEEVLKATKNFNAYTIADENAEMGMRTQIEPIIEVSEDCISREFALEVIDNYGYNYPTNGDKACAIKNAPSVVPSCQKNRQVEREEGEWYRQTTDYFDYWECSECGMGVGLDDVKNYCPNCGAKMKGADDVEDD